MTTDMKKIYSILLCAGVLAAAAACNVMGLEPTNKVSPKVMLSSEDGVQTFMANLYYRAPFHTTVWANTCTES